MEKRRLGRTGHLSTVVILGGAAFGKVSQPEADEGMRLALEHGVNHIDVAPTYGDAELRLAPWVERMRDRFFLGCKTGKRDRRGAEEELRHSLERLRTDSLDLYQLHSVTSLDELDAALGPAGALEAFLDAREQGLTRYIGITSHGTQAPVVLQEALHRFDFDTVLFPLNFVQYHDDEYRHNTESLLALTTERDVGVMCIKSIAKQPWGDRAHTYHTWYDPFDDQESVDRAVRFVLSQPVTGIPHAADLRLMPKVLDAAQRFTPMSREEREALIAEGESYRSIFED